MFYHQQDLFFYLIDTEKYLSYTKTASMTATHHRPQGANRPSNIHVWPEKKPACAGVLLLTEPWKPQTGLGILSNTVHDIYYSVFEVINCILLSESW